MTDDPSSGEESSGRRVLAHELATRRSLTGMSLRQVEEASKSLEGAEPVSNAYLSQLENAKVTDPSPRVLHTLSRIYGVPYATLMTKIGYFMPDGGARLATFADHGLTEDEEREALEYITFRRNMGRQRS